MVSGTSGESCKEKAACRVAVVFGRGPQPILSNPIVWMEESTVPRFHSPPICPFLGPNWKPESDGVPGYIEKGGEWIWRGE